VTPGNSDRQIDLAGMVRSFLWLRDSPGSAEGGKMLDKDLWVMYIGVDKSDLAHDGTLQARTGPRGMIAPLGRAP